MPSDEDRLRARLRELGDSLRAEGDLETVAARRRRLPRARRAQALALAVAVTTASIGGGVALYRAFGVGVETPEPVVSRSPAVSGIEGEPALAWAEWDRSDSDFAPSRLVLSSRDGTEREVLLDEGDHIAAHGWSPDGTRLVFSRGDPGALWTADVETGDLVRLTEESSDSFDPDWSPDGSRLAFVSQREGFTAIYTMAMDGTDVRRLTAQGLSAFNPDWSPDGRQIAFSGDIADDVEASELYVMNADGSNARRIVAPDGAIHPAWSPDGGRIAFVDGGVSSDIWLVNSDGRFPRRLMFTDGLESGPSWSPDGRSIAFSRRGTVGAGDLVPGELPLPDIFLVTLDGSETQLTSTPDVYECCPTWNPSVLPDRCLFPAVITGDFNGDDRRDEAQVFGRPRGACGEEADRPFVLEVVLATGGVLRTEVRGCWPGCRVLAAPDFDLDGRDELLVQILPHETQVLGVYYVEEGQIMRSREFPSGDVAEIPWGGSATLLSALTCEEREGTWTVLRLTASLDVPRGSEWTIRETAMTFDGRDFHRGDMRDYVIPDDERSHELLGSGNVLDVCRPPT